MSSRTPSGQFNRRLRSARGRGRLGDLLSAPAGYAYSRIENPTSRALADAVAELHGADAGFPFATGMAAAHAMFVSLLRAGDHVVASRQIYGSVQHLLENRLGRLGIESTLVDASDLDAVSAAFRPNTRVLHVETIANPTIVVADLPALAAIAHRVGVADSDKRSPRRTPGSRIGADRLRVVHEGSRPIDVWAESSSAPNDSAVRRAGRPGATLAPLSAFLILRGIATLQVRMERHTASALAIARALEAHDAVRAVYYPGLASHPQFGTAQRVLRAAGGMLAFDLGDRSAAAAFLDALTIPPRTASLGSVMTMAVHPPSTTHRQIDGPALAQAGILEGSCALRGLEDSTA